MRSHVDLFVIGAGSGGVRAARLAGALGKKVVVAEDRYLGGTCVNVGCVPKKLMVYASHFHEDAEDAKGFGWKLDEPVFDWPIFRDKMQAEVKRLNGIYANLLAHADVALVNGRATLEDAKTVRVGEETWTADRILIATGGWPFMPPIPGIEYAISSNDIFSLEKLPKTVVVVGGGYIALEMSCILHDLGVKTTMLVRGKDFLRHFDRDVRDAIGENLESKGIALRCSTNVTELKRVEGGVEAVLTCNESLVVDQVLMATGRRPLTDGLGLEKAGVELGRGGEIKVDEFSRTTIESIWAIGDVTNRLSLTPVAIEEAVAFVKTEFEGVPTKPSHESVATAVFSQPPCAMVGLTEAEAREAHSDVAIFRSRFRALKHTISGREERSMMKVIVDRKTDRVLGMHMVGPDAGEIIQGFAVAVKMGVTKAQLDATIGVHPTAAEEFVTLSQEVTD